MKFSPVVSERSRARAPAAVHRPRQGGLTRPGAYRAASEPDAGTSFAVDAARLLGVAARFASGYFHCAASMAGHASTHAWAEVYLPRVGWRGFDPTLGTAITPRHVVTGVSSYPRGVMPVSGAFAGSAGELVNLEVAVRTAELDQVDHLTDQLDEFAPHWPRPSR